jgi:hypothetical protein
MSQTSELMADGLAAVKPYPGLRSFRREEYGIFFGRDDCLDQMIKSLEDDRFLAVIGPSGNGKSSLVRAAFFHELSFGLAKETGSLWQFADIAHPARTTPFDQLARALLMSRPGRQREAHLDSDSVEALATDLEEDPFALLDWTTDEENLAPDHNLLILVDQFEELYTYDADEMNQVGFKRDHVARFIRLLLDLIERADSKHIYIVITMRAEHLNLCTTFPGLAERFSADAVIPPRMSRDQWRAAIEGPANYLNRIGSPNSFSISEDLIDVLLNDLSAQLPYDSSAPSTDRMELLGRQADQLPLLQHVLNGLWQEAYDRRHDTDGKIILTREAYTRPGYGLNDTLNRRGREMRDRLTTDREKKLAERIFRSLVDGPSISRAFRRPCTIGQLAREAAFDTDGGSEPAPELIGEVRRIVDLFRDEEVCFLTPIKVAGQNRPIAADDKISISHESLIRQWEDLIQWYNRETRDRQQWKQIVSLLGRDDETEGPVERILHAWDKFRNRTTSSLLWRSVTLRDVHVWWKGLPAVSAKPARFGFGEVNDRPEISGAFPFPGWIDRYFPNKGKAQFKAATAVLEASLLRRQRRKLAGYALTVGTLSLATASVGFASYKFQQGEKAQKDASSAAKHANDDAARAKIDATQARMQATQWRMQAAQAKTQAAQANMQAAQATLQAQQNRMQAQKSLSEARLAVAEASRKDVIARNSTTTARTAVNNLVTARITEFDNYANARVARESPESYDAYLAVHNKIEQLREMNADISDGQKSKIADASLAGALHATSQLDREFLELAVGDVDRIKPGIKKHDPIIAARLMLAKGRLAIWDGEFKEAVAHYEKAKLIAANEAGSERLVALASAGLAESSRMAGLPRITPQQLDCGSDQPISGETNESTIAQLAAWARCVKARIESAESADSAFEKYIPIQLLRSASPRVKREISSAHLALGDMFVNGRNYKNIAERELAIARRAYSRASSPTAPWLSHLVKNHSAVSGYAFDFEQDSEPNENFPNPAPFQGYTFVDIYGYLRTMPKYISTQVEEMSRQVPNELSPKEFSSSAERLGAIGSLVRAQTTSRRPDIFRINGEGNRLMDAMLNGASLAPIIARQTPTSKMSELAALTRMSISMAADSAVLIDKLPVKDQEAAREKLGETVGSLAEMFRKESYYSSFLNYAGGNSRELVVDPSAVTTLKTAIGTICDALRSRDNCGLAKAFEAVELRYDRALSEIKALEQEERRQVNRLVWTDKHGIALGGIDVAACLRDAEPVAIDEIDVEVSFSAVDAAAAAARAAAGDAKPVKRSKKGETTAKICSPKVGNLAFARRVDLSGRLFGSTPATFLFVSEEMSSAPFKLPELNGLFVDALAANEAPATIIRQLEKQGTSEAFGWIIAGKLYFTKERQQPDQAMITSAEKNLRGFKPEPTSQRARQKE